MLKVGVTGTDTGVGKTTVASALLALLRARGVGRVSGMKPIETGVASGMNAADAEALRKAAGGEDPLEDVCPLPLEAPLAPLIAARVQGKRIDLETLDRAFDRLSRRRAAIVVEGAGGLLTPITQAIAYEGLFRRWGLDLLVVAANRLGALNHTLLTVRAAAAAGLPVRAVVLNDVAPLADRTVRQTSYSTLVRLLRGIPVLEFPLLPDAADLRALVAAAESSKLLEALTAEQPNPVGKR